MQISDLITYFSMPTVTRGVITRPENIPLKDLSLDHLGPENWNDYIVRNRSNLERRIPLTLRQLASLFVKEAARIQDSKLNNIPKPELSRAIMMGLYLSQVSDKSDDKDALLDKSTMTRYRGMLSQQVLHNDFIPVYVQSTSDTFELEYIDRTIRQIFDESNRVHASFDRLAYPARNDGIEEHPKPSQLVRFLEQVKGYGTLKIHKLKLDEFPGPGVAIIDGLTSKMFPKSALRKQLIDSVPTAFTAGGAVKKDFRELVASLETALSHTSFGLFRGLIIISNPQLMEVSGKPYALIVFNDHFQKGKMKMAYLIPDVYARDFMRAPLRAMKMNTPCDPEKIEAQFKKEILNLNWTSVIAGMQRAIPVAPPPNKFYPDSYFRNYHGEWYKSDLFGHERIPNLQGETKDFDGHMHTTHMDEAYKEANPDNGWWKDGFPLENLIPFKEAHDEISKCVLTGFALWRLFNRAFNVYSYGYNYKNGDTTYKLREPLRLLEQSIRWSLSPKEKNKPFLVPMTETGFDEDLVEELGVVDTKLMVCYRRNRGTFMLPRDHFEDLGDSTKAEARDSWIKKFLTPAFHIRDRDGRWFGGAHLVFMPGDQIGPVVKDILRVK
jgi:hypothetical protein